MIIVDMLKDERFDFTILENKVLRDTEKFNKNEVLAYMAISTFADKAGSCFPSYDAIAKVMRTSRRTAIEGVNGLVEKGIIKVQNRQTSEKKKELTSNLYTLVSCDVWDKAISENRKFLIKRASKYSVIVQKSKVTKIENKIDKKNKPVCDTDLLPTNTYTNTNNENLYTDSITPDITVNQEKEFDKIRQNSTKFDNENVKLLRSANIKYAPYKKQAELIAGLNTEMLIEAIRITRDKASVPNWNYLIATYGDLEVSQQYSDELHKQNTDTHPHYLRENRPKVNTRFHNINQTFKKYSPEELERMLLENQKEKFDKTKQDNYKKTGFHNFEETFTQYSEDELESIVAKSQEEKFGKSFVPSFAM